MINIQLYNKTKNSSGYIDANGTIQHDLDAYKQGIKNASTLIDCLWGELYGSINIAEIDDGIITPEHADYLRKKFLWRSNV